jgi:hypothetical protein
MQSRREGVKGVTVSRGPGLKKGPGDHKNKRKTELYLKVLSFRVPNTQAFRARKFSGPELAYSIYTKVNL